MPVHAANAALFSHKQTDVTVAAWLTPLRPGGYRHLLYIQRVFPLPSCEFRGTQVKGFGLYNTDG